MKTLKIKLNLFFLIVIRLMNNNLDQSKFDVIFPYNHVGKLNKTNPITHVQDYSFMYWPSKQSNNIDDSNIFKMPEQSYKQKNNNKKDILIKSFLDFDKLNTNIDNYIYDISELDDFGELDESIPPKKKTKYDDIIEILDEDEKDEEDEEDDKDEEYEDEDEDEEYEDDDEEYEDEDEEDKEEEDKEEEDDKEEDDEDEEDEKKYYEKDIGYNAKKYIQIYENMKTNIINKLNKYSEELDILEDENKTILNHPKFKMDIEKYLLILPNRISKKNIRLFLECIDYVVNRLKYDLNSSKVEILLKNIDDDKMTLDNDKLQQINLKYSFNIPKDFIIIIKHLRTFYDMDEIFMSDKFIKLLVAYRKNKSGIKKIKNQINLTKNELNKHEKSEHLYY